jgi:hypothetical protein
MPQTESIEKQKFDIDALDEDEIDRLVGSAMTMRERKELKQRIRARDDERVLVGLMSFTDFDQRWPLGTQGRSPEDVAKIKADRLAKFTLKE